jgi:sulfur-carrier protein
MGRTAHSLEDPMASGTIRYWAAAKAAAGTAEEKYEATTLAGALSAARERHMDRPEFARVLRRCSFLVDGAQAGAREHDSIDLTDGGTVEVLPGGLSERVCANGAGVHPLKQAVDGISLTGAFGPGDE